MGSPRCLRLLLILMAPAQRAKWLQGVVRDHQGAFIGVVAGPVGRGNSLMTEILALRHGLTLLHRLNLPAANIQSDSKVLVDHMGKPSSLWILSKVWEEIQVNMRSSLKCINHIVRECNKVADGLSRWGHSLPTIQFTSDDALPLRIQSLLRRDARGWVYFRYLNDVMDSGWTQRRIFLFRRCLLESLTFGSSFVFFFLGWGMPFILDFCHIYVLVAT